MVLVLSACTSTGNGGGGSDQPVEALDGALDAWLPSVDAVNREMWTLYLDDDRLMAVAHFGEVFPVGEVVTSTADVLELTPDVECNPDAAEGGTYTVRRAGDSVIFEAVTQDTCGPRQELLTTGRWEPSVLPPTTTEIPEPKPADVVAEVDVPGSPGHLTVDDGAVWVAVPSDLRVYRIDPVTNAVVAGVEAGGASEFKWLGAGEGGVWVSDFASDRVDRVDPATNAVTATIPVGIDPTGVLAYDGRVWVSNHRGGTVSVIDPSTNTVVDTVDLGPTGPRGPQTLTAWQGDVVVAVPNAAELRRIDTDTLETSVAFSGRAHGFVDSGAGSLWTVEGGSAGWVTRLAEDGAIAVRIGTGEGRTVADTAVTEDGVWALTTGDLESPEEPLELLRIDPATDAVVQRLHVLDQAPPEPNLALGSDGDVWISTDTSVLRVRPPAAR